MEQQNGIGYVDAGIWYWGLTQKQMFLAQSIDDLDFCLRTYNCLNNASITTVSELVQKTERELLHLKNMGRKSVNEIMLKIEGMGLSLRSGCAE